MLTDAFSGLQTLVLPDRWQAEAIHALKAGRDVVIDAPTGAGKTYIFERWAEQTSFARRALFTVPTRALANDKYAEWRGRGWRVGIITGDVTIDPGAPLVVATLEAVHGTLTAPPGTRAADPAGRFQLLVVDEYHWLADPHRGSHYEGTLLALDPSMQLLLLSGAVGNPEEVAGWLRRLGRTVEVVQTKVRPVPLEEVEVDDLVAGLPRSIEGFWSRRVAGALRDGLGPVLVFAPHRQDAERLARQFARELPLSEPLTLTPEQETIAGPALAKLLRQRVAYHHSGLTYGQRAGLIEPLAKAGQLRSVVATLGLSAGINFSLRSVLITASSYRHGALDHEIAPHELLQMIGRAGRRGLDDLGYVLVSASTPRARRAAQLRLKRAAPPPWTVLLRGLRPGDPAAAAIMAGVSRLFADPPIPAGNEDTATLPLDLLPCGQRTDTGRARLVRRSKEPFPACATCARQAACLALSPQPTLLWQLQRAGLLDRELRLTARGAVAGAFLGSEGLAIAAALEDRKYPLAALVYDCANLFGTDRFSGTNPRRLGRLATVCERAYRRLTIEGWLEEGLPPQYGYGAGDVVQALVERTARAGAILTEIDNAGRGDLDRLMTEWRSLLRQVAHAPALEETAGLPPVLVARWNEFRTLCRAQLGEAKADALPTLPALTAEQRRPVQHRFFRSGPPVTNQNSRAMANVAVIAKSSTRK